jgi:NADH:ubiquinone oxidoreductase subunit F (NADH-binding)
MSGAEAVTMPVPAAGGAARQAAGLPRLLPPVPGTQEDLRAHLARFGPAPKSTNLIETLEYAGLTGRGGAAFPVHRKLTVAGKARGRKVMIGNGAESEPASRKDAVLLRHAPHLVLDGLQLAAEAIGASQVYLYLHQGQHASIAKALEERARTGTDRREVIIALAPPRFLAGQETALVNRIEGGPALPTFTPPRVPERGIGVHNVETLAHLALIARYGPHWFRQSGTSTEPGTMLTTIHTTTRSPSIREIPLGTPLDELISTRYAQAVLIGGYHGTWLKPATAEQVTLDNTALNKYDAALGAGVIAALPEDVCGLKEAARVTRYLAAESAGQCGPCLNGLPRIAAAMAELAGRKPSRKAREDTERWLTLVTGRGACRHPDGTVRFVSSALTVFAEELTLHTKGHCSATTGQPFLPLPDTMPSTDADWT